MSFEIPFKSGSPGVFVPSVPALFIKSANDIGPVTLFTLTPPLGERVRIVNLTQNSSVNIAIFISGTQWGGTLDLQDRNSFDQGVFSVGSNCVVNELIFEPDEVVRLDILESMTNGNISYAYDFGSVL